MRTVVRYYWFALSATILIWSLAFYFGGPMTFVLVALLSLLEITFSVDNAVINSKMLEDLSRIWQILFMTIGIVIAVFVVRFVLPIVIVAVSAHLGVDQVIDLAFNHPHEYSAHLVGAEAAINAFGGSFLLLIALSFFIDYEKKTHWLGWLERRLGQLGRFDNFTTLVMLIASLTLYVTVAEPYRATVLFAAICAMALHGGLLLLDALFTNRPLLALRRVKTGLAAFITFMYLQVLDATFSMDSVVGAFALTNDVIIIMAGLGAGAVWVRAITVHMVRSKTLHRYRFLEHGAHWAIAFLGTVMLLKLYDVNPPQWLIGSLGLITVIAAIWWSVRARRQSHHATFDR